MPSHPPFSPSRFVTDCACAALGRLRRLHTLNMSSTHVSGRSLGALQRCRMLRHLDLSSCAAVRDVGLAVAASLQGLTRLDVGGTHVTNNGLKALSKLPLLKHLGLGASFQLDALGLEALSHCSRLAHLEGGGFAAGAICASADGGTAQSAAAAQLMHGSRHASLAPASPFGSLTSLRLARLCCYAAEQTGCAQRYSSKEPAPRPLPALPALRCLELYGAGAAAAAACGCLVAAAAQLEGPLHVVRFANCPALGAEAAIAALSGSGAGASSLWVPRAAEMDICGGAAGVIQLERLR